MQARLPPAKGRLILLYLVGIFLFWFAQYIFVPGLPEYARARTGSLALVGVVLSMYGLWQALVRFPLGVVIDALGRPRPFLLAGIAVALAGCLLLSQAGGTPALIVGRSMTGAAMGAWVPMVVGFSGLFPSRESVRASALLTFASSIARVAATALNGPLAELGGERLPFQVAAAAGLLAAALFLPMPARRRSPRRLRLQAVVRLITGGDVLLPSLQAIVIQYVSAGISLGFLPILARRLGAGDLTIGLLVSANLLAMTAGNLAATGLASLLRPIRLLGVTYLLLLAGTAGLAVAGTMPLLFLLQAVLGLAHGVGFPVLMGQSIQRVGAAERSTAMGLFQSVYALGMFAGPWVSGLLAQSLGLQATFILTAVLCLAAGLAGVLVQRRAEPS